MSPSKLVFCFVFATGALYCQGIISSTAGTGFSGFSGDGGPATAAQLYVPQNAAVDSSGTIYFSDSVNRRIRKITPDGIITTIAGNGIQGTSGDGGPALSASLGIIYQVAISPDAGKLCFGDYQAYKIRCVILSTGIIQGYGTGQAMSGGDGGPVANASFYFPRGAAYDSAGNFYLADFAANRVRRVDAITGIVTTLAGGGNSSSLGDGGPAASASLSFPSGLQYSNGSLYIADQGNSRIRRVDLSTSLITTVAGNGSPYSSGDGGPALAAGMTPAWVTLDTSGKLFIVESNRIRMVDTVGIISTIAGNGNSGWSPDDIPATQVVFGGIDGIAWDPVRQRLLISDYNDRIRQIFFTPPTTTALNITPNPAVTGQPVVLSAAVSPASATGVVRFHNGSTVLGTATLAQGAASFNWTPPGSGPYSIYAVYGGDSTYNLSASSTVTITTTAQSSTSLTASPNPANLGAPVTLTALVTPSNASGSVQFYRSGTLLGSAPLSGGQAQLIVTTLPAGANSLTAVYGGNASVSGSSSPVVSETIKAATTTVLTASPNPSTFPAPVTLAANVSPASATGFVQFFNSGVSLGSVALSGGKAQLSVSGLPAGTNSLIAVYGGDGNNASSTSAAVSQTVTKAASSTSLSATPASQANSGQNVTFTAKITPSAASGTVQFFDGATMLGASSLNGGTAVFSTSLLANGNHAITAAYGGDSNVNPSQSSALSFKVKR